MRKVINDIFYVSKLTGIKNKKLLIIFSILLSQLTAATDLALIAVFAAIIADQLTNIEIINLILEFFISNKFLIGLLVLLRYLISYLQFSIMKQLELAVTVNLKDYMFRKILEQKNYSKADTFYFINTLSTHIAFFYSNFAQLMNHVLQSVAYFIYLLIADVSVVTYFGTGALILIYPSYKLIKAARDYMHKQYEAGKFVNKTLINAIENLPLIKILRMEESESKNFRNTLIEVYDTVFNNQKISFINQQLPNFFTLFVFALILNFNQIAETLTLAFLGVTVRMFQSLSSISTSLNSVVNSQVHVKEFILIEDKKNYINKGYLQLHDDIDIKLEGVFFKYANSEEYIFENLNILFEKNSHNLIVGANGTGKTTLLGLIGNILIPEKGKLTSFTENFAYIGATPFIFQKSLRENILYGNKLDIEDSVILETLYEFETFKEKSSYDLDREVETATLSSGQLQKLAFTRALLNKPKILLLDEAMANLDEKSKELVLSIMKDMKITVINSTHDPERFVNIDAIIKIESINEKRIVKKILQT